MATRGFRGGDRKGISEISSGRLGPDNEGISRIELGFHRGRSQNENLPSNWGLFGKSCRITAPMAVNCLGGGGGVWGVVGWGGGGGGGATPCVK